MNRWQRVGDIFDAALPLDAPGREALLSHTAIEDPTLAAEVRRLLSAHDRAGGAFLEQPAWAAAPELLLPSPGEAPPAPSLSGRRVGPYFVADEIGRGGMGVVYAARDERLGRDVALKVLAPALGRSPVARERLAREARAAASLAHPAIAIVYALEDIDGDLYIASELVRGATLRAELATGPLSPEVLRSTLTDVADALAAAHACGIVHRDLKPENVLRAADGRVKVVDFGIARSLTTGTEPSAPALTLTGGQLGTPGYMAPEQLRGQPVDARADVFAFGVMAYELATGTHPFGGSDPAALIERLVSDHPPLSMRIEPPGLDALIRRCLGGDPAVRPASGDVLVAALRQLAGRDSAAPAMAQTAWWWQFHQIAVVAISAIDVATLGFHKHWIGPMGGAAFFALLVLATIAGTLRLHLWFVSVAQPNQLRALRGRVLRWVIFCEALLVAGLLAVGSALVGPHDGPAAWFIVTALLLGLSLLVIEPATTRAARV